MKRLRRRWTWIEHVLRMGNSSFPRVTLTWALEGKHKRGRDRETRRWTVEKKGMARLVGTERVS